MSDNDTLSNFMSGKIPADSIYPVLRATTADSETEESATELALPLCDSHQVCFRFPIPGMNSYLHVAEQHLADHGLDLDKLCEIANSNLARLFNANRANFSLSDIMDPESGEKSGIVEMLFAGESDDATLVSGLLVLEPFMGWLVAGLQQEAGWPRSMMLAAATPIRGSVLLCNLQPGPRQADTLRYMRHFIEERFGAGGACEHKPVSKSILLYMSDSIKTSWFTLPE